MTDLYDENKDEGSTRNGILTPEEITQRSLEYAAKVCSGIRAKEWGRYQLSPTKYPEAKREGEIYCYGPLVDEGTRSFFAEFNEPSWSSVSFKADLEAIESSEVKICINSPGGLVSELSAILLAMNQAEGKTFTTVNEGMAYSAASVVLAMGDVRKLAELSETMIHNAQIMCVGDSVKLRKVADRMEALDKSLRDVYARQLDMDKDKITEMMNADTYLSAAEASEMGFGEIITKSVAGKGDDESNNLKDINEAVAGLFDLNVFELI